MGLDKPGGAEAGLTHLQQGADRLAGGSRQVADGVDELVEQVKLMAAGLNQASDFLLTMRHDAADPSMAGFNIPAEVLASIPEGRRGIYLAGRHSVRYLVQTKLNPFSSEAMDQVGEISDVARGAQPTPHCPTPRYRWAGFPQRWGYPRLLRARHPIHHRRGPHRGPVHLTAPLRSVVAPLYLVGSVVISFFAASASAC